MHITLNGEARPIADGSRILDLVERTTGSAAPQGVAVALNGEVVRRADWPETPLSAGDAVEILQATAGG